MRSKEKTLPVRQHQQGTAMEKTDDVSSFLYIYYTTPLNQCQSMAEILEAAAFELRRAAAIRKLENYQPQRGRMARDGS